MGTKLSSTEIIDMSLATVEDKDIRFIYNELRKASIVWEGRKEVLKLARKKVFVKRAKNGNPVYKFQWQCAACKNWTKDIKQVEVDHIVEIGGVTGFTGDWNGTIKKIFPRPVKDHFQVLCLICHKRKTGIYLNASRKWCRK